ncbi:hypothetical protein H6771_00075 [Candidatus Peribacteria bacterium]|nr:hypothetical protein [Candidatus Peribacteria bacterium]
MTDTAADYTSIASEEKKDLIRSMLLYLQVSTMDPKEKATWTLLMPSMSMEQLRGLEAILQEEVHGLADLYLSQRLAS